MALIYRLLDWLFFRYALPYGERRGFFKKERPARPLVVRYDEILQAIHEDKMKNKPGVYSFIAHGEDGSKFSGFILGKDVIEQANLVTAKHLLALLHESVGIEVYRLDLPPEDTGITLQYLRALHGGAPGLTLPVDVWCKARQVCATIFTEPETLNASAKLLFEHKGE